MYKNRSIRCGFVFSGEMTGWFAFFIENATKPLYF